MKTSQSGKPVKRHLRKTAIGIAFQKFKVRIINDIAIWFGV
jgi:hypothetical protein